MPCSENISKMREARFYFIDVHEAMNRFHLKGAARILCNSKQNENERILRCSSRGGILKTVDRTWLSNDLKIA